MNIKNFSTFFSRGAAMLVLSLGAAAIAIAWSGPPGAPTACPSGSAGCDAPINISATGQSKAGNLGIGIANPAVRLDVSGTNVGYGGQLRISAPDYAQITFYNTSNTTLGAAGRLGDIYYDMAASSLNIENQASGQKILLNGNIGVGGQSPKNQLTLNSSWGAYTYPEAFSIYGTYPSMAYRSTTSGAVWLNHLAGNNYLYWYNTLSGAGASDWGPKMWLGPSGDLSTASSISSGGNINAAGVFTTNGGAQLAGNGDVYMPYRGQWLSQALAWNGSSYGICYQNGTNCPSGSLGHGFAGMYTPGRWGNCDGSGYGVGNTLYGGGCGCPGGAAGYLSGFSTYYNGSGWVGGPTYFCAY